MSPGFETSDLSCLCIILRCKMSLFWEKKIPSVFQHAADNDVSGGWELFTYKVGGRIRFMYIVFARRCADLCSCISIYTMS